MKLLTSRLTLLAALAGLATQGFSQPANDTFANRIGLAGMTIQSNGSNVGATKEAGEPDHAGNGGGKSVWWTWTAPASGGVTLSTEGSSFDTLLGVYQGISLSGLSQVGSNDNRGTNFTSLVSFNAISNQTYQIAVDGANGAQGSVNLSLRLKPGEFQISSFPREDFWIPDSAVNAVLKTNGLIYLGGDFLHFRPNRDKGAVIDTITGLPDLAFPKVEGVIRAAVPDEQGGWYIGGAFDFVGGVPRSNLARILSDNSVDPNFNPGADDSVRALVLSGSTLYVGGKFNTVAGLPRTNIAALEVISGMATAWNPTAGFPSFTGLGGSSSVSVMVLSSNALYVGGYFGLIGGGGRGSLAALDLTTGQATPWAQGARGLSGYGGLPAEVKSLKLSGNLVYVGGHFTRAGGLSRTNLAALDATTGNAITNWNPNPNRSWVYDVELLCNSVFVAGDFTSIGGQPREGVAALDAATGLATGWRADADGPVAALAIYGNSIYAGGTFENIGGQPRENLAVLDTATGQVAPWSPAEDSDIHTLTVSANKLLVGGLYRGGGVARKHLGALDARTGQPTAWAPDVAGSVSALVYASNTIYLAGTFTNVNGQPRYGLAAVDATTGQLKAWRADVDHLLSTNRNYVNSLAISGNTLYAVGQFDSIGGKARAGGAALNASTAQVLSWNARCTNPILSVAVSSNTVYLAGQFSSTSPNIGGQARSLFAALDASTGLATAWNPNLWGPAAAGYAVLPLSNTVYVAGDFVSAGAPQGHQQLGRFNPDGSVDTQFSPNPNSTVVSLAVQPDGKILVGGDFSVLAGWIQYGIGRLNIDGTLDLNFNPDSDGEVSALAIQPNGKILVGGYFDFLNGWAHTNIGRLNASGSIDNSFSPWTDDQVNCLIVQPDGRILVAGVFNTLNGVHHGRIGRLNSNGTLDNSFTPEVGVDGLGDIWAMSLQPDGKIVVAGYFRSINGQTRYGIGRLNADGTIDSSFIPQVFPSVYSLASQMDGKIIVGGLFSSIGGQPRVMVGRVNPDGSPDNFNDVSTFNYVANDTVWSLLLQPDGKVVVGGYFDSLRGEERSCIGRLNPDGTLDASFQSAGVIRTGYRTVDCLALQADGKILAGGYFSQFGGLPRTDLAALDRSTGLPTAWNPNPLPPATRSQSLVNTLAALGSTLYLSGTFGTIGGEQRNHLAALDSSTGQAAEWNPDVRSELAIFDVFNLTASADSIYAGGIFTALGGRYRPNFAAFGPVGAPRVTRQPRSQTIPAGNTIHLDVEASGQAPLSYQWQFQGTNITGATSPYLDIANAQDSHSGDYTVVITNLLGLVASSPATVTVLTPVIITLQPQSQTVTPGANVTLSVTASGNPPPAFQWRINGVSIPGATASTLTIANVQPTNGGSYQVVVANPGGAALSAIATLVVSSPALPFADNLSAAGTLAGASGVGSGSNAGATKEPGEPNHVGIRGGRSVWVCWIAPAKGVATFSTLGSSFDTALAIYGGTNYASLTSVAEDEDQGGFYTSRASFNAEAGTKYLIVVDGFSAASGNIVLSWNLDTATADFPKITAQPLSLVVTQSQTATFSVTVLSPPPLRYQWFFNCMPIPGATNVSLTVTNVQSGSLGNYHVVVQNASTHSAESFDALLQIGPVPGVFALDKVEDDAPALVAAWRAGPTSLRLASTSPGFVSVSVGTIDGQLFNNSHSESSLLDPTNCFGFHSTWFDVRAEEAGVLVIDTLGSQIDTLLAVYFKVPLPQLYTNFVACDNNGAPDGLRSLLRFAAPAGQEYWVMVYGTTDADRGLVHLNWKMGQPPQFQGAPTNSLLRYGDSVVLRSPAPSNGLFPIRRMQWLRDGVAIAGATNSTLSLVHLLGSQSGAYSVMASNDFGATTNVVALVAVDIPYLGFEPRPVNGAIRVWLQGPPGQIMILESSSDLRSWIPWSTNSTDQNSFRDIPADAMPQQFFRARPR